MASPLPSLSLIFFLLLFFASSVPTLSQKTQLTRRNLVLLDEQDEQDEQPMPKPKSKKKTSLLTEQAPKEQPVSKPKSNKQTPAPPIEQASEDPSFSKSKTKKKNVAPTEQEPEDKPAKKKKTLTLDDSKNQTKPVKPKKSNSTSTSIPSLTSTPKSKLNKTQTLKPTNSTKTPKPSKIPTNSTKIPKSSKNSTKTFNSTKPTKPIKPNTAKTQLKTQNPTPKPPMKSKPVNPEADPESIWAELSESDSDLISEFRDLPTRIQQTFLPDLKKLSVTSKAYIYKANKNIAENVKPFVGKNFAPKIATTFSCVFLVLPLCLVTILFYQLNSYLSLQRFLIFVQAYLAIYFFTLALTAMVTGLEPLRFFYATSPSSYAWTQAVQTLGYLLYLLAQLIHLVVVFSASENKVGVRALGLAQMIVGLAVGCHYYAAVFHRAVTGDAPRANWKVHGIYGACFLVILLLARAEGRKKAYDGGEDGKKS